MGGVTKTQTKQAGPSSAPEAPARAPAGLAEAMADTPLGRTAQVHEQREVQVRQARQVGVGRRGEMARAEQAAGPHPPAVRADIAAKVAKVDDAFEFAHA